MSQWKSNDNLFSLQGFYDNIVALFERDPQDPWVIDTLQWWNGYVWFIYLIYRLILYRQVPGLQQVVSKRKKRSSLLGNKIHSNPADRILAQRAQHAITNDQENHQQASHPCASPAQQPSVSHPQTDLGNHHQDQQLPQGRAQGQSSQHPRCHSQPQPHRRAMVRIFSCFLVHQLTAWINNSHSTITKVITKTWSWTLRKQKTKPVCERLRNQKGNEKQRKHQALRLPVSQVRLWGSAQTRLSPRLQRRIPKLLPNA